MAAYIENENHTIVGYIEGNHLQVIADSGGDSNTAGSSCGNMSYLFQDGGAGMFVIGAIPIAIGVIRQIRRR